MSQRSNAPAPMAAVKRTADPVGVGTEGHVAASPAPEEEWNDFRRCVRRVLETEARAALGHAGADNSRFAQLWDRLDESLDGGKLTRPRLVLLAYGVFGGGNRDAAATLGAAFEMLHSALLIHDDVIDRDLVRRGRPTVGALYRKDALDLGHAGAEADHVGNAAALIGGDILLAGSLRLAARAGAATGTTEDILDVMNAAVLAAAAGELDDLVYSLGGLDIDMDQVLDMERLKTASYSFEAPLRAGAVLAGTPERTAERMGSIGRTLGIAYQVIDDVLGTFGDPAQTGKSIESDLRADKKTILGAFAAHDAAYVAAHSAYHRGEVGIEDVRAALKTAGAEDAARRLAHRLVRHALAEATDLAPETTLADDLADVCTFILERTK
ncbi:polyprenyl synthetase family protein [Arthrobacter sp. JSM 101049]|uniref:polyprenyl synthetase family protein n=1 Tax=Arthrobacter sp. JSM 101049 TaxID=929097 RepID=UPI003566E5E8